MESYRDHPEHIAVANGMFWAIAGDRIGMDVAENSSLPTTHAIRHASA